MPKEREWGSTFWSHWKGTYVQQSYELYEESTHQINKAFIDVP